MITITGNSSTVVIDKKTGLLVSRRRKGLEFIATDAASDLFRASLRNAQGNQRLIGSQAAGNVACREESAGSERRIQLTYTELPGGTSAVVYITAAGDSLRWRMEMDVVAGYAVEWVDFPAVTIPDTLIANGGVGTLFWPAQEGVVIEDVNLRSRNFVRYREPGYPAHGWSGYYPSACQMQFMAFMQGDNGLYIGCHDTEHHVKYLEYVKHDAGHITIQLRLFPGAVKNHWTMPYEVVMESFDGDWHDAAQIYRTWIRRNPTMRHTPLTERDKLPEWVDRGTVVMCYPVRGEGDDKGAMKFNEYYPYTNIVQTAAEISRKLDAPLMPLVMHWEGTAPWAPPFVWPPAGSEENFRQMIRQLHAAGHYFGVYCSGIGWTQQSMIDKSYSCEDTFRELQIQQKVCRGPRHEMYSLICNGDDAQRWGYDLCAAADGVDDIVVDEILKIADSGCDYVQFFDQNLGGLSYLCYADDHGHPPAPGNWEVPAMKALMQNVSRALRQRQLSPEIGCEAAASEPFIETFRFNDLRANINFMVGTPVPAYNYVYHEYVCNFSGNQNPAAGIIDVEQSPDNLLLRTAMGFISGDTITITIRDGGLIHWNWGAPWADSIPDQDAIITLIRNMNQWRQGKWKEFLLYGAMEKPYPVACEKVPLHLEGVDAVPMYPAVLTSRWSFQGREAQFFVNYRKTETEMAISLQDDKKYMLYSHDSGIGYPLTEERYTIPPLQAVMMEIVGESK